MNNDILMKRIITKSSVLTEARAPEDNKYAIPNDVLNGTNDTTEEELADEELANANPSMEEVPEEEPTTEPDTTDAPTEDTNVEPVNNTETQTNQNPDFDENGDDPTSVANDVPPENTDDEFNSTEFGGEELNTEGDISEEDISTEAQETPGLRILSSISDSQYNLLNIELFKKFERLVENIKSTINIDIAMLSPMNDRLVQAKDIVHNNLTRMINDLQNYMTYVWHNEYESNVVAYGVFMKRYKIAMDIIMKIRQDKSN